MAAKTDPRITNGKTILTSIDGKRPNNAWASPIITNFLISVSGSSAPKR